VAVGWVERAGLVLIERPAAAGPFRGTWDLPAFVSECAASSARALERGLARRHGLRVEIGAGVARLRHAILHRNLRLSVFRCTIPSRVSVRSASLAWCVPARIDEVPVSGATRKIIARLTAARIAPFEERERAEREVDTRPVGEKTRRRHRDLRVEPVRLEREKRQRREPSGYHE
jgi:hypothetical protein